MVSPPTAAPPAPGHEGDAPAPAKEPATDPDLVEQIKAAWPEPASTPAQAPAFACALFNDGLLYLEIGDDVMTLQVDQTRTLMCYLERIGMPETS
jgi:hypothetical protein